MLYFCSICTYIKYFFNFLLYLLLLKNSSNIFIAFPHGNFVCVCVLYHQPAIIKYIMFACITYAWSFLVHFVFIFFYSIIILLKNIHSRYYYTYYYYRFSENPSMEKINIKKLFKNKSFLFSMKLSRVCSGKYRENLYMCIICSSTKNFFLLEKFNVNAGNLKDILVCLGIYMERSVYGIILSFLFLIYSSCVYVWLNIWVVVKGKWVGHIYTHTIQHIYGAPKKIHFNNKTRKQCNDDDKKL